MVNKIVGECVAKSVEAAIAKGSALKKGILGTVKVEAANEHAAEIAKAAAEQTGASISAAYNKVVVHTDKFGRQVRTTTGFNEVTQEVLEKTAAGEEIVSRYSRTTPRGTYVVETSPQTGLRTKTSYTSPSGVVRETLHEAGHPVRFSKNIEDIESQWVEKRGDLISAGNGRKCYADGSEETYWSSSSNSAIPDMKYVKLDKNTIMYTNLKTNVSTLYKEISGLDGYTSQAMHKNPVTGAISTAKVSKDFDEYGREIRKVSYKFPEDSKIQNAEFNYLVKAEERLTAGYNNQRYTSYDFPLINGSFVINGEVKTMENNPSLMNDFCAALKDIGIDEAFILKNTRGWEKL